MSMTNVKGENQNVIGKGTLIVKFKTEEIISMSKVLYVQTFKENLFYRNHNKCKL
jgi:hypothetical protein